MTTPRDDEVLRTIYRLTEDVIRHIGGIVQLEHSSLEQLWLRHGQAIKELLGCCSDELLTAISKHDRYASLRSALGRYAPESSDPKEINLFYAASTIAAELFHRATALSRQRTVIGVAAPHPLTPSIPQPPAEAPLITAAPEAPTRAVEGKQRRPVSDAGPVVVPHAPSGALTNLFDAVEGGNPNKLRSAASHAGKRLMFAVLMLVVFVTLSVVSFELVQHHWR